MSKIILKIHINLEFIFLVLLIVQETKIKTIYQLNMNLFA